jgi:fatty-acyl-CoA synthase
MPDLTGIGDYVSIARSRTPDRSAIVSLPEDACSTYAELDERSTRVANALRSRGLVRGDRIAIWATTSIAYVELYFAAAKARLVLVPVNESYTTTEARVMIDDAQPRVVAFDAETAARVAELELGHDVMLIDIGAEPSSNALAYDALLAASDTAVSVNASLDDAYILGYTSGTTGTPKGALLTHASVLAINRSNAVAYHLVPGSIGLFTGSMSFTATVPANLLTHLYVGGTVVLTGTRDPRRVVDVVADYRANYVAVPPPLVRDYAQVFRKHQPKVGSLVSVLQSAGPGRPDDLAELNEALDGRLLIGWGMTENSGGLATVTAPGDMRASSSATQRLLSSVGQAVPGYRVRMIDDDGAPLESDGTATGELSISGPALMAGYWRRPEETAAVLSGGWYRTGDVGRIDPDGVVTILDRRTDLIVSGGLNVYPREVETVLRTIPGVVDCAVVGVPHPRWGRAVAAAIVLERGANVGEAEVAAACRGRLAGFKKPVVTAFVEQLPRTLGDKVHRPSVVALLSGAATDDTTSDAS